MRRSKLFILTLFAVCVFCPGASAQITPPQVTTPNPETYSFTKHGDLPIGLFTGTMQYSIPLYKIVSGKLSHDVSISYSTNGVKVDEISSREGLGWTLNAGGVVNRSVMDKQDEFSTSALWPTVGANPTDTSWDFWQYIKDYDQSQDKDLQPDEFFYKCGNISGKFYKARDNSYRQLRYTGVKIERLQGGQSQGFILTQTDGTKYYFLLPEASRQFALNDESYPDYANNTWYLKKIVSLEGDSIVFNYDALLPGPSYQTLQYKTGVSQNYSTVLSAYGSTFYSYISPVGGVMSGNGCNDAYLENSIILTIPFRSKLTT